MPLHLLRSDPSHSKLVYLPILAGLLAAACQPTDDDLPADFPTALAAGDRLIEARAYEQALPHFERLAELFPQEDEALDRLIRAADRLGRPEAAIPALERRLVSPGDDAADEHLALAAQLAKAQHNDDAKHHYREALGLQPDSAAAHLELSRLEARTGNYDAAIEAAAEGVRQVPDDPRLKSWYGEALFKRGRGVEAVEVLHQALELDGAGAYPRYLLGLIHLEAGRLDQARRELEAATELQATAHEAWYQLANVLEQLGETEAADQAIREFARLYRSRLGAG